MHDDFTQVRVRTNRLGVLLDCTWHSLATSRRLTVTEYAAKLIILVSDSHVSIRSAMGSEDFVAYQ